MYKSLYTTIQTSSTLLRSIITKPQSAAMKQTKLPFISSSTHISGFYHRNWIVVIPLLCIIVLNTRNLILRKITVNYEHRIKKASVYTSKVDVIPSDTCLTADECNHARQQIGIKYFESGSLPEYGCIRKGLFAYWGQHQPSTSSHMREMYAPLHDEKSSRIHCNHTRPRDASQWPGVAWLLSFPNSGTSFTGALVRSSSSTVTATNYGSANTFKQQSKALFQWSPVGPFITDPKSEINGKLEIPKNGTYVLTKTHCSGFCFGCHPKQYVQTQAHFRDGCRTGDFVDEFGRKQKAEYDISIVNKAVHLVRDPFDNIVSRYHLKRNQKADNVTWSEEHPNSIFGFRKFCTYVNSKLNRAEEKNPVIGKNSSATNVLVSYRARIPCYSDFVRYFLWHNHAIETIDELGVEHMTLYYESYARNYEGTKADLFQFLGLTIKNGGDDFRGSERYYRDYFTKEEIAAVQELAKDIASKKNWNLLRHYFD